MILYYNSDHLKSGSNNSFCKSTGVEPNQDFCLYLTFVLFKKRETSGHEDPATAVTYSVLMPTCFCALLIINVSNTQMLI